MSGDSVLHVSEFTATPGPWELVTETYEEGTVAVGVRASGLEGAWPVRFDGDDATTDQLADGRFIAEWRNAAPAVLLLIDAAREVVERDAIDDEFWEFHVALREALATLDMSPPAYALSASQFPPDDPGVIPASIRYEYKPDLSRPSPYTVWREHHPAITALLDIPLVDLQNSLALNPELRERLHQALRPTPEPGELPGYADDEYNGRIPW